MKFVKILTVGAIIVLAISGCSGKAETPSLNQQLPHNEATIEAPKATDTKMDTIDYSQYFNNQDSKRGEQIIKLNPRPLRVNSLSLSKRFYTNPLYSLA
ncbi:hypothetical protein [Paenibacillus maysiensis]|uniref:hypothetical protein n=1 Tax=Paenibacillus maysiensis TaxID=1155954 RepID=UPI0004708AD3|nr:hypothetical protein [Paenibacillus maysiensis]